MTKEISETLQSGPDAFGWVKWKITCDGKTAFYVVRTSEDRANSPKRWAAFECVVRSAFK